MDANLLHQKNVWMLRLLASFFAIASISHILFARNITIEQPMLGIAMLVVLYGFVESRRWPRFTMMLTIVMLCIYLSTIVVTDLTVISYIFLGLLPLLSLFYQNYAAIALAGVLYTVSGLYFFLAYGQTIFAGVANRSDAGYFLVYGLFILSFCLIYTLTTIRLSQRVEYSEQRLSDILESVSVGIWTYDFSSMKMVVSEGFERLTGYPGRLLEDDVTRLFDFIHPEDHQFLQEVQQELIFGRTSSVKECRIIRPDGEIKWIQNRGRPYFNSLGHLVRLEGVIIEITERKQLEESFQHLAYHDELTGLPNRTQFAETFADYAARGNTSLALMFLDLDNFKEVNDTLGHEAGDYLLRHIAGRLSSLVRGHDMVCRLGGDEFVILLVGLSEDEVMKVAERIRASLTEGFDFKGKWIAISASIGISMSPDGNDSLEEMLRLADATMYDVKRGGGSPLRFSGERSMPLHS
ncbi:diguanylate cyclase [Paenibacillus macerans]|uniref:diguanylate cyclase n=1 Tax=Paenibacillus macerans TaxID=44252 RepID=UPI003D31E534